VSCVGDGEDAVGTSDSYEIGDGEDAVGTSDSYETRECCVNCVGDSGEDAVGTSD